MHNYPSKEIVDELRMHFPKGCRVELLEMDDPQAPKVHTCGTCCGVDDIGSILVNWDSGGSLNVILGEDHCRRVEIRDAEAWAQKHGLKTRAIGTTSGWGYYQTGILIDVPSYEDTPAAELRALHSKIYNMACRLGCRVGRSSSNRSVQVFI